MPGGSTQPDATPRKEQRKMAQQLARQSERLRAAIEAIQKSRLVDPGGSLDGRRQYNLLSAFGGATSAPIVILDGAGRIVWVNHACEKVTGYTCAELEGEVLSGTSLVSKELEEFQDYGLHGHRRERAATHESHWTAKDGTLRRIIWSLSTFHDSEGTVEYIVGTGVDVTERSSPEESARLERLRLQSLLDISQKAAELSEREIVQHTVEEVVRLTGSEIGYLHLVNPDQESIQLLAWSSDALKNCTAAHDSHYPLSKAGVWADCARLKRPVVHNDYQSLPDRKGYPEGHSHLVRHASVPITDGDKVVLILGVGNKRRDYDDSDVRQMLLAADSLWKIVLRKRAEEELRSNVAALREADRQKDEFLAMLAHELRNPLAPISSALNILDRPDADARLADSSRRIIRRQVEHLTRLIDDLLDVSRITRGKITLKREPVDLMTIVGGAVEDTRPLIQAANLRLAVSAPAARILVEGDPVRLTQILSNLLHNAAKYTPQGGSIDLAIRRDREQAVVEVKDSGVGIPASMLPHVFDLFAQGEQSLDRAKGGLGLGLTLVRRLVELHGGSVEVASEGPGLGSLFTVRLPLAAEGEPVETSAAAQPAETKPAAGRRVLVVDDNKDAADTLTSILELSGYRVETVFNGPSALESAASFAPDVVLLDVGLPEMDGYQVAENLRRSHPERAMVLIAVTGYGHPEAVRRGTEAGFDHYLVKPVNIKSLCDLLSRY